MAKYKKLAPNFHLITNPAERFRTELNLTFSSGGAFFESKEERGLSHLLEHCIIKETKNKNKEELDQYLFEKDIYRNASTGRGTLGIVLSGHKSEIETMLDLILAFAFTPIFSDYVLQNEKDIVLKEFAQRSGDPGYRLDRDVFRKIYEKGSLERLEVLGSKKIIAQSSLHDLKKVYKRILKQSHIVLSVVGGNTEEELVLRKVQDYVKNFPSDETLPIETDGENKMKDFKHLPIVHPLAHEECNLTIGLPCPVNKENTVLRQYYAEKFFSYPTGTFYKLLREELGLIYGVNYGFSKDQFLHIYLTCETKDIPQIVSVTKDILENYQNYISQKKLDTIKSFILKRKEIDLDNPFVEADFIENNLFRYGVLYTYQEFLKELKAVSLKDVEGFCEEIKNGVPEMRIVGVSKSDFVKETLHLLDTPDGLQNKSGWKKSKISRAFLKK